ncbi:AAA domain-containing protein [Pseudomonas putida]|uniref:NERD domain-containing protein n=1 Tax=Pseudomonas putida TaxID=303 RepID=A0ABD7BMA9_PSEPU|nr:AAA domain-containing protein [Pseudomonas putida]QOD00825.1 NERD domain-containing protein [Pseudomonas putida]
MKIIVKGKGLHGSETKAVARMEAELRNSWHAYASVLICDSQGGMEFDLIIVTHDRILIVELKNWRGKLTSFDGNWYIDGKYRSKSPYHTKRDQGYRLLSILRSELQHKLGYYPFVEAHVVLCGEATPEHLPANDKPFVHTLEEFMKIREADGYSAIITGPQAIKFDDVGRLRPNDPVNLKHFDDFFRGSRVELATFKVKGFEASEVPDHQHEKSLFSEFPAQHEKYHGQRAMIRRWDLTVLGIINREDSIWQKVVTREDHLYRTASATNSPLQNYMLRPLESPDEDNISADCVAMYELKKNTRRLGDYIAINGGKWTPEQKLDIVRALLAPFAELHSMGVAHRDIQPHNLWYAEDSAFILASGFHASHLPEKGTVRDISKMIKSSASLIPEDIYGEAGEIINPFAQDVYLLGIIAHKICFPDQKMTEEEGLAIWQPVENDPFKGKLDAFFAKAMDLEQDNRYPSAAAMHAEFNAISLGKDEPFDDARTVIEEISKGDFIKRELSPFAMMAHFPPTPGGAPTLFGEKIAYRCAIDGENGLFKFWQKAAIDLKNPSANRRLLRMRRRIEKAVEAELPIAKVLQFGLFGEGAGLFILTRFEEGTTWDVYIQGLVTDEEKLNNALALCELVIQIHSNQFAHGDLHPANILVRPASEALEEGAETASRMVLIDSLDWGGQSEPYNTEYGPTNPQSADGYGRDKFAVYRMVEELFGEAVPDEVRAEIKAASLQPDGIPVDLSLLRDCLKAEIERQKAPPKVALPPLRLIYSDMRLPETARLLQAEGLEYHLSVNISDKYKNNLFCVITAHYQKLTVILNPESRQIMAAWITDSGLNEYAQAAQRPALSFTQPISVERGIPPVGKTNNFLEFLMDQDAVLDILEEMFGSTEQEVSEPVALEEGVEQTVKPSRIWQALMDTEGEQRLKVEIRSNEIEESKSGAWLIPCTLKSGNELEFSGDEDEEIGIYLADETRQFGHVIAAESGDDILAVHPHSESLSAFKKKVGEGTEIFFESKRNHASRFRRQKAMDRVLSGNSRIHNLPGYFDEEGTARSKVVREVPSEESIRARYDNFNGSDERMNPKQVVAFQKVISQSPISVLQGPPGTGKTKFVSQLINYLFENGLARNILLVGQSHTSVDTVAIKAKELCEEMGNQISLVRLGQEHLIDEKLLQCHSSSIQRKMRHKFQREYEQRINALASRLMLDQSFVEDIAKLHRSISPLLSRIAVLLSNINDLTERREQSPDRAGRIDEFKRSLDECAQIVNNNIRTRGYEFKLPEATDPEYWRELVRQIAANHGVTNQLAIQRLNHVIAISKDWIDVLASGSASFDRFFVKSSQLVTGTLVGMGAKWLNIEEQEFDWVIVDEAGRAQASELMIALQCASRGLLVGDHRQLSPHYEQSHVRAVSRKLGIEEAEVRKTDFERAFIANEGVTLDTQYRMIEPIGEIVSHCFYGGQLKSHRKVAPDWYVDLPYPMNKPVAWIDSGTGERAIYEENQGGGRVINRHELQVCMHLLRQIASSPVLEKLRASKSEKHPFPIGIIVMYSAQKRLLEAELSRSEWMAPLRDLCDIATVDSYQGQERGVVILCLVRNNPERRQGFLVEPSRINVSLSRAQERLVVIGAKSMWEASNKQSSLADVLTFISEQTAAGNENYELVDGTTVIEGARNV